MNFAAAMKQAAIQYGMVLTAAQQQAFASYFELLVEWNGKMNLTAITAPKEVAVKHMIDSLSCYHEKYFPTECKVIDVGTGAGFPGLPLKIFRPDITLTLLDSLNKRLLFLQAVVDRLQLSQVRLLHSRAEDAAREKFLREQYQIAVSRAVARLNVLCELCLPFVAPGGYFIALKGARFREEVAEAKGAIALLGGEVADVYPVKLPETEDVRAVIYIKKQRNSPLQYPRKAGIPGKKPL
ncbi:MAG: 16S rRNA (guanine(527)-N(7))-methyltransferase RsmG [Veillonellales bacterium]